MLSFGEKLKAVFKKHKITQEKYAKEVGSTRVAVGHLTNDRRSYNQKDIEKLVKKYPDVDLNWLLKDDDSETIHQVNEPNEEYNKDVKTEALKKKMRELLDKM